MRRWSLPLRRAVRSTQGEKKDESDLPTHAPAKPPPIAPRPLRPADSTRPAPIVHLPTDLLSAILDVLQAISPHTLSDVAATCSWFYHHTRYAQHRVVELHLDRLQLTKRKLTSLATSAFLPAVRELRVIARRSGYHEPTSEQIGQLLSRMTGLQRVYWEFVPISAAILAGLRELGGRVRLEAKVIDEPGEHRLCGHLLTSVIDCEALEDLSIDTFYTNSDGGLAITQRLKKILLSCPNLSNLSLNIRLPPHGCVPIEPPRGYPGIGFANGERPLRPFQSLVIQEYPWGYPSRMFGSSAHSMHCEGYPETMPETEYWADNFDWSALTKLEITNPSNLILLKAMRPHLTALKELSLAYAHDYSRNPTSNEFVRTLSSMLDTIKIKSIEIVDIASLEVHASTLRSVEIHQLLDLFPSQQGPVLPSVDDIARIVRLPKLEHLGIDLSRSGSKWPQEIFSIIAQAPWLRSLEIWFALGAGGTVFNIHEPNMTASTASNIFTDLRDLTEGRL
jgi:hypothetical protein